MPRIDLHAHTDRSDGTFAPAEVVRLARRTRARRARADRSRHDRGARARRSRPAPSSASRSSRASSSPRSTRPRASTSSVTGWTPANAALHDRAEPPPRRALPPGRADGREAPARSAADRVRARPPDREAGHIVRPHLAQAMVEAGPVARPRPTRSICGSATGRPGHVPKHALDPLDAVALDPRGGRRLACSRTRACGERPELGARSMLIERDGGRGDARARGRPPRPPDPCSESTADARGRARASIRPAARTATARGTTRSGSGLVALPSRAFAELRASCPVAECARPVTDRPPRSIGVWRQADPRGWRRFAGLYAAMRMRAPSTAGLPRSPS